jgi:hypothetical protein
MDVLINTWMDRLVVKRAADHWMVGPLVPDLTQGVMGELLDFATEWTVSFVGLGRLFEGEVESKDWT